MQKFFKNLDFKTHILDDKGSFSGYASVFNVRDSYYDIILPGAFHDTLCRSIKLLWQHEITKPIGKITKILEDTKGLFIEAKLDLSTQYGWEAYSLLKSKSIDGLSIGFIVKDYFYDDEGIRMIKSLDLYEISVVTMPANEESKVIEVKDSKSQLDELIKAVEHATDVWF